MRIIVDAYGGDFAPGEVVSGVMDALAADSSLSVTLTGNKEELSALIAAFGRGDDRITIVDAKEVITNDESPTMAVKLKKDSSLVKGLELLAEDESCGAFVSAGSTGAVLAGAFMKVGRIKGVSRPALAPVLPTVKGGGVVLCDCGANVDCKPLNLLHFAVMGCAFAKASGLSDTPRVGLLSNGAEDKKGNELNREAFVLLSSAEGLNFVGNCEARDLLSGEYDVVVADGFNGNIALKSAEGTANAIFSILMDGIDNGGLRAKLGALLLKPVLRGVKRRMDYNAQGGACFLGVKKVVVKLHGASKRKSVAAGIAQAAALAKAGISREIAARVTTDNDQE